MSKPFSVEILSDEEDDDRRQQPSPFHSKNTRTSNEFLTNVVVLDDDPTPEKPNPTLSTPSYVPETPFSSHPFKSQVSLVKCTSGPNIGSLPTSAFHDDNKFSAILLTGGSSLICLESDSESEDGLQSKILKEKEHIAPDFGLDILSDDFGDKTVNGDYFTTSAKELTDEEEKTVTTKQVGHVLKQLHTDNEEQYNTRDETKTKKRKTKEENARLAEEKKQKREQEKLQKEALKAEAAAARKMQKDQQKWEKGKFALKSIVAEIDAKVVELGIIGGHLLTRFAEKGLSYRITSNPIERSILWKMSVPEEISELSSKGTEISYVLLVYEPDAFCNLVLNESIMDHVSEVQSRYSSYTICYLTNKLMAYINKREQAQYKNQANSNIWRRPPVEEVLSKLTTDFARVHSRHCRDEAEVADHVVGLTCALANCHFRPKLTRLSINANGAIVPKEFIDRNLIKKSCWLKALVSIPKVQPRFAVAIGKKYPTMKSLLNVYMDPSKSVHEKETLLKDLPTEGTLGEADRRVGPVCSKRVYRVLMAQNGNIKTDDVELGADFFR